MYGTITKVTESSSVNYGSHAEISCLVSCLVSERGFAGFPQFEKQIPHKIYVGGSNGGQKNCAKDKY